MRHVLLALSLTPFVCGCLRAQVVAGNNPYAVAAPPPAGFDRAAAQRLTRTHLDRLIRIDTRNPPGNERLAAQYFDSVFRTIPGVETHIVDVGDGRANFVARLRAPGATKRPVLILGHMDVVGADTTKWDTPPLEPVVRGEYLYGRGAIDDKGMLAAATAALTQLSARRGLLQRDIIFLATAGEEGGPPVGIGRLLAQHRDLLGNAEFALNEGGRVRVKNGAVWTVNIQTTEKVAYNVRATARGRSGHGSVPLPDNALAALARAAVRVHEWRAPVRLNATTRTYFARLALIEEDSIRRDAMRRISASGADAATISAAAAILSSDPLLSAALRTGQSLTLVDGGIRSNVIPSEGTANFNVRILPGEDIREVVAAMQRAGGEDAVTFTLVGGEVQPDPPPSPAESELFAAMERGAKVMAPRVVVIPFMSTGGTDGAALRMAGIPTYGILPLPLPLEDELRMHGDNERVPVAALGWAAEYLYRVLDGVAR